MPGSHVERNRSKVIPESLHLFSSLQVLNYMETVDFAKGASAISWWHLFSEIPVPIAPHVKKLRSYVCGTSLQIQALSSLRVQFQQDRHGHLFIILVIHRGVAGGFQGDSPWSLASKCFSQCELLVQLSQGWKIRKPSRLGQLQIFFYPEHLFPILCDDIYIGQLQICFPIDPNYSNSSFAQKGLAKLRSNSTNVGYHPDTSGWRNLCW